MQSYTYVKKKLKWSDDECSDFFDYFHPQIVRMVRTFTDMGKPFEYYFTSTMKWQVRIFLRNRREENNRRQLAGLQVIWDSPEYTGQDNQVTFEADYITSDLSLFQIRKGRILDSTMKRRFFMLCLKAVRSLDDLWITRIATLTGYDRIWISEVIHILRNLLLPKERRLRMLSQRRNTAFFRVLDLEGKINGEVDAGKVIKLEEKLARAKHTMKSSMKEIAGMKLSPSNRMIACALGIPKGTVDSSFHWLKKRLSVVYNTHENRYA